MPYSLSFGSDARKIATYPEFITPLSTYQELIVMMQLTLKRELVAG